MRGVGRSGLLLSSALMAIVAMGLSNGASAADQTYQFDIPAEALGQALTDYSRASSQQIVFSEEVTNGKRSTGLHGRFTASDALKILLTGTDLVIDTNSSGVIGVRSKNAQAAQNERAAQGDTTTAAAETVMVTAEKRPETLQNVPISASVLSGRILDKQNEDITAILNTVPGVATVETIQGGGTQIIVRGVVSGYALFSGSSPVGYYLDSAPFGTVRSAIAPDSSAYDLDRVEVLRGPQGTLFGASSLNGVVRILTNDPDLDNFLFKGRASDSGTDSGGGNNYRWDAAVNVPIIDGKLAARVVVGREYDSGWIDNPIKNGINNERLDNIRAKIKAQPTDDLSIVLSLWHSREKGGAPSVGDDNHFTTAVLPQPINTRYDSYDMKVVDNLPLFSVSSSTSYLNYKNSGIWDLTPAGAPLGLSTSIGSKVISEELTLTSNADSSWIWSAGAFYRNAKDLNVQYDDISGNPPLLATNFTDKSESYAIYGEIGRRFFGDEFGWTLGIRQFHDNSSTQANGPLPGVAVPLNQFAAHADNTSPRVVLSWYADTDLTAYASFSEGFRSGFAQDELVTSVAPTLAAVNPDTLYNYEIGAKGSAFEHLVDFDVAAYHMDWQNVQQELGVPNPIAPTTSIATVVNAGNASGEGVDAAITIRPAEAFDFGGTLSWNNLAFDETILSSNSIKFEKGGRLGLSPEWTAGVFANYDFDLGATGYHGRASASANYTSQLVQYAAVGVTTGKDLLTSRASVTVTLPDKQWAVTLYGNNLNNEQASPLYEGGTSLPDLAVRIRPRTVGLQIEYSN